MTGFDVTVLLVVGFTALMGLMRGFVREVLSLAAWAVAILCIHNLHAPLTDWLETWFHSGIEASVVAFLLLALVPYALVRVLATALSSASRQSVLGPVDRLLGLGFGAVKGIVVVVLAFSVVMLAYDTAWGAHGRPEWIRQARCYSFVNASSEALVKLVEARRRAAAEADGDQAGGDATDAASSADAAPADDSTPAPRRGRHARHRAQ